MLVVTGYVHEVGDRDDGVPEVVFDSGGDVMVRITHLSRDNVAAIAEYYGKLITMTWCGSHVLIGEIDDQGGPR